MNKPDDARGVASVDLWIGGKRQPAASTRYGEVTNPALGRVTRRVPFCNAADIDAAVKSAAAAFPGWRDTPPLRRARVMQKFLQLLQANQKDIARLVTEEHGKTLPDAMGSVQRGIEVVEFACGIPHLLKGEYSENVGTQVDTHTVRQPVGVCAGITPFNFPVMVPLWMFPMAIACGNTFILKPSDKVPRGAVRLVELMHDAGLPAGVLNLVHGAKETVDLLLGDPRVKAVSFVGSSNVARYIYQTASHNGKRVQALGGAKNHSVVLPDADMKSTVAAIMGSGFGCAGERCLATSVVVAVGEVADPLVKELVRAADGLNVGAGCETRTQMGPVITSEAKQRILSYIELGEKE